MNITKTLRKRRSIAVVLISLIIVLFQALSVSAPEHATENQTTSDTVLGVETTQAKEALDNLVVKGRAPKTDYARSKFGDGWAEINGCDLRNIMLKRAMTTVQLAEDDCKVLSGAMADPYTAKTITFQRGELTSDDVQIDHVVALSDAWQKGAQGLSEQRRIEFANDPLNLLAVDGDANQQKGDSDAASWLPPNKGFRCQYVARQIAVKQKYSLWVTDAEKASMQRILNGCGEQVLPIET